MLIVSRLNFNDLTEDEKKNVPDNGCGKEEAGYIKVRVDGKVDYLESDSMALEDANFNNDLHWIVGAIRAAYATGQMESGIFDKNGKEVKSGNLVAFPFIDPLGNVSDDVDFTTTVVFKHGCFGYDRPDRFVPLFDWSVKEEGEPVPNIGLQEIITDKYIFWIVE